MTLELQVRPGEKAGGEAGGKEASGACGSESVKIQASLRREVSAWARRECPECRWILSGRRWDHRSRFR